MQTAVNRGYLHEDYRLFHSTDHRDMDFQSHFHDFHKIVLCLSGRVTYIMEGVTYYMRPWDILVIPEYRIHQSVVHASDPYERIILWIGDAFLRRFDEPVLEDVFQWPVRQKCCLFRPEPQQRTALIEKLGSIEQNQSAGFAGHRLMTDTYLLQFLLELDQMLRADHATPDSGVRSDPRFDDLLSYINRNLSEDLSVDALAKRFYISSSHLMHAFKRHTGCTVHQYIRQKRLICAANHIQAGESITAAATLSGFADYTTFLKAFRKQYGCAPSELKG